MAKKATTKKLAVVKQVKVAVSSRQQAETLISQAIDKNTPVETMEKLLTMRRELKAEFAKEAYDKAMSGFQSNCPIISKDKMVKNNNGSVRYSYAPIDSIVKQTRDIIKEFGFSYSVNAEVEDTWVTAICKITHELGHSEISKFKVPIDEKAFMNRQQKFASALTFAKRYAFCNAFGILSGDEDDDSVLAGQVDNEPTKTAGEENVYDVAKNLIESINVTDELIKLDNRIEKSIKFTTEQKKELRGLISLKVDQNDKTIKS